MRRIFLLFYFLTAIVSWPLQGANAIQNTWVVDISPHEPGIAEEIQVGSQTYIFISLWDTPGFYVIDSNNLFYDLQNFSSNDEIAVGFFKPYNYNNVIVLSSKNPQLTTCGEAKAYLYDINNKTLSQPSIIGYSPNNYIFRDEFIILTDGGSVEFPDCFGKSLMALNRENLGVTAIYEFPYEPTAIVYLPTTGSRRVYVAQPYTREIFMFDVEPTDPSNWTLIKSHQLSPEFPIGDMAIDYINN
jgi:hypothetical protein